MEKLSNMSTAPEVIAVVDMPEEPSIDGVNTNYLKDHLVLVLDGVKDPGNMGTIIRIADWFGIEYLICSEDCVELYNPKVIQSTMGSILRVKVHSRNLTEWLNEQQSSAIYGALLQGENCYTIEGKINGILVMGSESHGISSDVLPLINRPITIPSFGSAESLNVAIATGILCSEAKRREF